MSGETLTTPNKHLKIPTWITREYFVNILKRDIPGFENIQQFTSIAATAPGENYTSTMVRVIIDVGIKDKQSQRVSYILKTDLESSEARTMINSMNLFPKEKQMYAEYLLKFEQLYRDIAGLDVQFAPRCVHIEETPDRITLVMEDLKCKHFKNIDRLKGFDMVHVKAVVKKLAEFHAASAVYEERNGPYESLYYNSYFNETNRSLFNAMYSLREDIFKKAMLEWNLDDVEKYLSILPEVDDFYEENLRLNHVDPMEFNVLNHGDCWSNNIMFTYNQNDHTTTIEEVLFVDFQISKWGSPAQDLWYLITNSIALDIKIKEFDHIIQIYHQQLCKCLKLLKYTKNIPTLKELHITMLKYGYWGVFTANCITPAILLPADKDANMDNMLKPGLEGDQFRFKAFTSPPYKQAMRQLYPFLYNKGIFDINSKA
uniref:CHK domain-containing protein n=1 Tax=Glossina brevipalpis TaxID=37001 RepID=A0A1A9WJF8_9MUSC